MQSALPSLPDRRCRVGLVQINNSFSGQNYLPYAAGLLEAYVRKFAAEPSRFEFLLPVYKRARVDALAVQPSSCSPRPLPISFR